MRTVCILQVPAEPKGGSFLAQKRVQRTVPAEPKANENKVYIMLYQIVDLPTTRRRFPSVHPPIMTFYTDLSYLYPLYPIVGGIAIILCAIPIPAHWKAGNIATVILGLWDLGLSIIVWVGTIVWHNNIENTYPIWGDIVNFYYAMFPTALASTTLCIQYRLWIIASARNVFITKKDVRIYHL